MGRKFKKNTFTKVKKIYWKFLYCAYRIPPHFFKTLHPTRLHADTGRDPSMCINKQIMIPLEVSPK